MEFLPDPQDPLGLPAMDLEEPKGPKVLPEDLPSSTQWASGPGGPASLSEMELDASGVQVLVQQLEALPGDLGGLFPDGEPCPLHIATGQGLATQDSTDAGGLLSADAGGDDLLGLLRCETSLPAQPGPPDPPQTTPRLLQPPEEPEGDPGSLGWMEGVSAEPADSRSSNSSPEPWLETVPLVTQQEPPLGAQSPETLASCPAVSEVPGPCGHEELVDGVIFTAKYLGSTQLLSERSPPPSTRMAQAQEAVDRVKAPEGETQPMAEVDIFISTKRVKVLAADSQDALMDHALQTISYIADIGPVLVVMARRRMARGTTPQDRSRRLYKMLCHVFHSEDAQLIAQAIGQAFSIAYSQFLQENGIDPSQVGTRPSDAASHPHNGDLDHFCNSQNCREVCIQKRPGEALGVALVESGWGSLLPTAVIANLLHGGPAERSGALSIGDRVTAINGTSLVGLSLAACQAAVREVRRHSSVTLSIIHCPPVTTAVIRRPHVREQLGFCVEDGIICSLLRGGAAERGGVRVGHRIIEVNGQSVVAMPHARIIQLLTEAREIHIKTMPAATYRLLTGQEQPVYL
ncbi:amyloid-beta A4 precursor protein-binding family A member 3 isoform X1 [Alexandromys fortis]|uniref:amyloid-beta A4 precursor protein-binding family A member 3 isoform X1 n=1 Tax=Alexandromys fortis TaxID=100897 RepID=UPI00215206DE|nr:amyloid-beta A4 precursor protein-binding family A member 3 isoform X1 [Microtus fortis]XP_049979339.1 amyloid-beta A4 precursor protein-binding family A member 3 isoform X1 [Microtus fortis]XP_049979340.1 amyloid-beta A4 precursor protein-binding family A member 3 isoform X1 [Microtus fortis]